MNIIEILVVALASSTLVVYGALLVYAEISDFFNL